MNDTKSTSKDSLRIILPKDLGENNVTFEDLFAICLDHWPDIDACEIGFDMVDGVPMTSRKALIPLERAVFKHTQRDGKVVFCDGFYPARLGHVVPAVEGILGTTDLGQVAVLQPNYLRIEFVKIEVPATLTEAPTAVFE